MKTLKKIGKYITIGFVSLLIMSLIIGIIWGEKPVESGQKIEYQIISERDSSITGRKRISIHILSKQVTDFETRAIVVMQAAQDLYKRTSCQVCTATLEISKALSQKGYYLSNAIFINDKKGNSGEQKSKRWNVSSSAISPPTTKEINIIESVMIRSGDTTEKEKIQETARKLKVTKSYINQLILRIVFAEKKSFIFKKRVEP